MTRGNSLVRGRGREGRKPIIQQAVAVCPRALCCRLSRSTSWGLKTLRRTSRRPWPPATVQLNCSLGFGVEGLWGMGFSCGSAALSNNTASPAARRAHEPTTRSVKRGGCGSGFGAHGLESLDSTPSRVPNEICIYSGCEKPLRLQT